MSGWKLFKTWELGPGRYHVHSDIQYPGSLVQRIRNNSATIGTAKRPDADWFIELGTRQQVHLEVMLDGKHAGEYALRCYAQKAPDYD